METNIHQIQVFPNPISTNATFRLTSKENTYVDFSIYNVKGQKIITIYSGDIVRNEKEFNFNSGNLPNGIYFMKAISNKQVATKKILIIH
ncbi:MAG: T9SS type A sorting domain-containing protein [Candidatus Cloacimonetes bacterium]|nr:T9SS type A sorting domain-containing protein [Candidatus Cloacimonadota bacterium]